MIDNVKCTHYGGGGAWAQAQVTVYKGAIALQKRVIWKINYGKTPILDLVQLENIACANFISNT